MGSSTAGHEKSDLDYVLSRKPDYVFLDLTAAPLGTEDFPVVYTRCYQFLSREIGVGLFSNEFAEVEKKPLYANYFILPSPE